MTGKTEVLGARPSQCRSVHHISHMDWPGIVPGPLISQPREYQPKPLHGESDGHLSHLQSFPSLQKKQKVTNIKSYELREVIDIVVRVIMTRFDALCEQECH
jgi:hypothetical protein